MRINEQIRVPKVRVISETGEQLGILSTRDAIDRARNNGLDLMEVAPNENPPVCKIMDYGKYKYQQQKKEHMARKKQHVQELKEVRMRPKTDDHDINIKLNKAREFLEDGSKVQFTMIFRGREQMHQHIGRETFQEILTKLDDVGKVERETRLEGRRMIMIMAPKGPVKKAKPTSSRPAHGTPNKPQPARQESAPIPEPEKQDTQATSSATPIEPMGTDNDSTPIQV